LRTFFLYPTLFYSLSPPPPRSTLFPYTTLFRSCRAGTARRHRRRRWRRGRPPTRAPPPTLPQTPPPISNTSARPCEPSRTMWQRSEEHTSELQSPDDLVCRLLLEKKKTNTDNYN